MPAGSAAPRPAVAAIGAIGTGSVVASGSADEAIAATPRAARTATRMARRIGARSDGRAAETHDAPDYCARHDLTPERYTAFALRWVDMGATIVGGCCEVGPAHIRHLHDRLLKAGHQIA